MSTLALNPELQSQLEKFAREHGQSPAEALDEAVATYLDWQAQDFEDSVRCIAEGLEDVKAGRTEPAIPFFKELLRQHDLPD